MFKINKKKFKNYELINFMKSYKFFLYLMIKDNASLSKFKVIKNRKLISSNKTKTLFKNSIVFYFFALLKNSTVIAELDSLIIFGGFDIMNSFLLNFIIAVHLNNKIYSKFCFVNFLNSYSYVQSKKLIYKFFVLKLKAINCKKPKKLKI